MTPCSTTRSTSTLFPSASPSRASRLSTPTLVSNGCGEKSGVVVEVVAVEAPVEVVCVSGAV